MAPLSAQPRPAHLIELGWRRQHLTVRGRPGIGIGRQHRPAATPRQHSRRLLRGPASDDHQQRVRRPPLASEHRIVELLQPHRLVTGQMHVPDLGPNHRRKPGRGRLVHSPGPGIVQRLAARQVIPGPRLHSRPGEPRLTGAPAFCGEGIGGRSRWRVRS